MSLSKRDTFVRYLDPKRIWWEDANGSMHFSVPDALKAFDLEDTPENRMRVVEIATEKLKAQGKDVIYRAEPDSQDYFNQLVDPPENN